MSHSPHCGPPFDGNIHFMIDGEHRDVFSLFRDIDTKIKELEEVITELKKKLVVIGEFSDLLRVATEGK